MYVSLTFDGRLSDQECIDVIKIDCKYKCKN